MNKLSPRDYEDLIFGREIFTLVPEAIYGGSEERSERE